MKTIYKLTCLAFLTVSGISCSDFLNKEPLVQTSVATYYSTDAEVNTAVIGLYSFMQDEQFQVGPFLIIGDDTSDDCDLGNSYSEAFSWLGSVAQQIQKFETQPTNWVSGQLWGHAWRAISNSSQAIENIEANKEKLTPALYNQYAGEAHFLRALYYFFQTQQYGPLPIVDHVFNYKEFFTPRATQEQTWEFIEKDLNEAVSLLPEKSTYPAGDLGRATKGAALTLLGKVSIYQKKWQQAYDALSKVIGSGEYSLEPKYADVFRLSHENGVESIFEIQHSISGTGWSNSNEGSILSFYEHDADPDDPVKWHNGWSMHCPTQDLVDAYELGDPRLHATVILSNEMFDGRVNKNRASSTGYQPKKWYIPYAQRSQADQSDNPKNIIIMRYADVLLYMAEACNELGRTTEALKYLEQVRQRARSNAEDANVLPPITTTDQTQLRSVIWHERRVELACEGQRFWDLVRQGRAGQVMKSYSTKYKSIKGQSWQDGKSEILPIPEDQVTLSNGTLKQNPKY